MSAADTPHPPTLPRPRSRRRLRRIFGVLLLSAVLIVSLLAVRIASGPLTLPAAERLAYGTLADIAGNQARVSVEAVGIGFDRQRGLYLTVSDARLSGPSGSFRATDTLIDVNFAALAGGAVEVREIVMFEPVAMVEMPTSGADAAAGARPGPIELLALADRSLARLAALSAQRGLERFELVDGTIESPATRPGEAARAIEGLNAAVRIAAADRIEMTASGIGLAGPWSARLDRTIGPEATVLRLSANDVPITELVPIKHVESGFATTIMASAAFGADGTPLSLAAQVTIGHGALQIARDPRRTIDRMAATITWNRDENRFHLTDGSFLAGGNDVTFAGTFTPPAEPGAPWRYRLATEDAVLAPEDVGGRPLVVDRFAVVGSIDTAARLLAIDTMHAVTEMGEARAVGSFDFGAGGPTLALALWISPMTLDTLLQLWPPVTAYDARKWVVDTIPFGFVTGEMTFALTPEDLDGDPDTRNMIEGGIDIDIDFLEAAMRLPGELPLISGAHGKARVKDKQVGLDIVAGVMRQPDREPVAVEPMRAVVADVTAGPPIAQVSATLSGPAPSMAALVARQPINALEKLGMTPDDVTGAISADVRVKGPIVPPIDPDTLDWSVVARMTDVASEVPLGGQTFSEADVTVTATPRLVRVEGEAVIAGIKASLNYTEIIGDSTPAQTGGSFVLTAADLKERGIDLESFLEGPIEVQFDDRGDGVRSVNVDLRKARVSIPQLGWEKPGGTPAIVTADVVEGDGETRLEAIAVDAQGVEIDGSATLAPDGSFRSAEFRRFQLKPGDAATLQIARAENGDFTVQLEAEQLDGRGLLESFGGSTREVDDGSGGPSLMIEASVDRLLGHNDITLAGAELSARLADGDVRSLALAGRTGGTGDGIVELTSTIEDDALRLSGSAADAGRLLRFLDRYRRIRGGRATLSAALGPKGSASGRLVVSGFEVADDPNLEVLIERTRQHNPAGLDNPGNPRPLAFQPTENIAQPTGTWFDQLSIVFRKEGDTIEIVDAVLRGPIFGGSADGVVDLAKGRMNLSGTFIPAYAFNNLFGRVPVFGELLGAGSSGGLIGVTFRLSGPIDAPKLAFNPMSAITPGILRKIFEYN